MTKEFLREEISRRDPEEQTLSSPWTVSVVLSEKQKDCVWTPPEETAESGVGIGDQGKPGILCWNFLLYCLKSSLCKQTFTLK